MCPVGEPGYGRRLPRRHRARPGRGPRQRRPARLHRLGRHPDHPGAREGHRGHRHQRRVPRCPRPPDSATRSTAAVGSCAPARIGSRWPTSARGHAWATYRCGPATFWSGTTTAWSSCRRSRPRKSPPWHEHQPGGDQRHRGGAQRSDARPGATAQLGYHHLQRRRNR